MSGQLYRAGAIALNTDNSAGSGGMRRKLLPTVAYCGSHPLADVSGPGSTIDDTAADSFKYCVAEVAGECQDSNHTRITSAGEIYANCPGNDGSTCTGAEGNRGVCVMELGPFSGQISQIDTSTPQNSLGLEVRPLTWGFVPFRFYGGYFWSARSLADGSWMVVRTSAYQRAADMDFLAKVPPPYTSDNVARDRFVPVTVTVPARAVKGATRAMVRFGYAENGSAENFYCTSRREACIAADALGQRSGQIAVGGGIANLQSGDPFDADTWKAGTKMQIMGSEWPILDVPSSNTLAIGGQSGAGKVSANGSVISFSNPGECVKHPLGTRITANSVTITVTNPWQCAGTATGNQVGVDTAVNWGLSTWTWDLGDLAGNAKLYSTTFHYAGEAFNGQPCVGGCTIRIPAISQRVLYYQVVYDSEGTDPLQVVAVP